MLLVQRLWTFDEVEGQITHLIGYVSSSELFSFHSLLYLLVAKFSEFTFYLTFLIFEALVDQRENFAFVKDYWFGFSYQGLFDVLDRVVRVVKHGLDFALC